uniref:Epidermal patterning factor-like protein n=1 Tax=Aegilops tauschii subsp. strangulata TaxID=200361 RepID=A0A453IU32_AEGTS
GLGEPARPRRGAPPAPPLPRRCPRRVSPAGGCAATSRWSGGGGGKAALEQYSWVEPAEEARRRELVGPGSSPPTCRSRCGRCHPCRPVHVAIQPGVSFPLEYYPEAWRCKCGDRLFMP